MRTPKEIDQQAGELEAKRRDALAQADALDAKATAETLEKGTSPSAEKAFRLRAQIPPIDRALAALQNERVEAVEREQAERDARLWAEVRRDAEKLRQAGAGVQGLVDLLANELYAIRAKCHALYFQAPRRRPDFDLTNIAGKLTGLAVKRLHDLETNPHPLELASPAAEVAEFVAMLLCLAPPETDESKNVETSSQPAVGGE